MVLTFLDNPFEIELKVGSTASIGIASRFGVGRVRHLATRTLWLQQMVHRNILNILKVAGAHNRADLGAKCHPGPRLRQLLDRNRRSTGAVQRDFPVSRESTEGVVARWHFREHCQR